jgi:hypothetical protein
MILIVKERIYSSPFWITNSTTFALTLEIGISAPSEEMRKPAALSEYYTMRTGPANCARCPPNMAEAPPGGGASKKR